MHTETVRVPAGPVSLAADASIPAEPRALIIFAHGSGSSRRSPRNQEVAEALQSDRFATVLFDLLTEEEEVEDSRTGRLRFDIDLLATRLCRVVAWCRENCGRGVAGAGDDRSGTSVLPNLGPVGLFGASTGAAAALVAAARRPDDVGAVVSRGGRPDLAEGSLAAVRAPTLLIVGGRDVEVMSFNERAGASLRVEQELAVVPRAGHLFAEPGALATVGRLAAQWFGRHLAGG